MKELFYEVLGCRIDGTWHKRGCIFSSRAKACKYAVLNKGKIARRMPLVLRHATECIDDLTLAYTSTLRLTENEIIKYSMEV